MRSWCILHGNDKFYVMTSNYALIFPLREIVRSIKLSDISKFLKVDTRVNTQDSWGMCPIWKFWSRYVSIPRKVVVCAWPAASLDMNLSLPCRHTPGGAIHSTWVFVRNSGGLRIGQIRILILILPSMKLIVIQSVVLDPVRDKRLYFYNNERQHKKPM